VQQGQGNLRLSTASGRGRLRPSSSDPQQKGVSYCLSRGRAKREGSKGWGGKKVLETWEKEVHNMLIINQVSELEKPGQQRLGER